MQVYNRRKTDPAQFPVINGNMPWYIKVLIQLAFWFGPMVLVAAVFLAMWAGWLPSPITNNTVILTRVESKLDNAVSDMRTRVTQSIWLTESMVRLQLLTCRNTSKTENQSQRCDDYWKR